MRRIFNILIILFILVIGASCNKKTIQVGLLLYSTNDKVVNDLTKELKKNIGTDYELIICDAEKNQGKQNKQFIDLLENECDIFIVNLVDRLAAKSFIEKCEQKNLPIIFFNREPLEEDINSYDKAYYVGSDGAKIGEKQAQIIANMFKNPMIMSPNYDLNQNKTIEMVLLKGEHGHKLSETIFEKCIENLNKIDFATKVLATEYADWDRETAKETFAKIYNDENNKNPNGSSKIELVITNDDEMSLGVIDFIFENNLQLEYKGAYVMPFEIVGVNINYMSQQAINEKYIYGSVTSENELQVQIIIDLLDHLSLGSELMFEYDECDAIDEIMYCKNNRFILVSGKIVYAREDEFIIR